MPLFEYECRGCGHHFEFLTRDGAAAVCPSCGDSDLQKQLSVFAVGAAGGGKAAADISSGAIGACGMCGDPRGPGSCVN